MPATRSPSPGSFRPRQGRIRRYAGAIPLPTLWFELGGPLGDFADNELWKLPNTYPFIRIDVRQGYTDTGTSQWTYLNRVQTPMEFATNVANRYKAYVNIYGPRFQAIGKPLRFGMLLAGIDEHDCPIKLIRHPADAYAHLRQRPWAVLAEQHLGRSRGRTRRNRIMQGGSERLGSAAGSAFFHIAGRAQTSAWATAAFAKAKATLSPLGFPSPEFLLTDIESDAKNYQLGYRVQMGTFPTFDRLVTAWFERIEETIRLHPSLRDYLLDGDLTFEQWSKALQTTLAGTPLPARDRHYYINHPHENDLYWRMVAINEASYRKSVQVGVYEPAKAAFGSDLKCGAWNYVADGRVYPAEIRPRLMRYWNSGVFDPDYQVPVYYPNDYTDYRGGYDTPIPFSDTDRQWNLAPNWPGRLPIDGSSFPATSSESQLEVGGSIEHAGARCCVRPLFPSSSIGELVRLDEFKRRRRDPLDRLLRNVLDGARQIWMFEPGFNDSDPSHVPSPPALRAAVNSHVNELNGRVQSFSNRRNRVGRFRQVSYPYLSVNRP